MTWNDLKRYVDDALTADGRDGSVEIDYFEITHPSLEDLSLTPEVAISDSKLVVFN
jgi:hypothetical protein